MAQLVPSREQLLLEEPEKERIASQSVYCRLSIFIAFIVTGVFFIYGIVLLIKASIYIHQQTDVSTEEYSIMNTINISLEDVPLMNKGILISKNQSEYFAFWSIRNKDILQHVRTNFSGKDTGLCVESKTNCESENLRNYNGFCNNLLEPTWGAEFTSYGRLVAPEYQDGNNSPRTKSAVDGDALVSASTVSLLLNNGTIPENSAFSPSLLAVTWSKFVAHDLFWTLITTDQNGDLVNCCDKRTAGSIESCFPVSKGQGDVNCTTYSRSVVDPKSSCLRGTREQLNAVTSYLDGSGIYGTSKEMSSRLRTFDQGQMKFTQGIDGEILLPTENGTFLTGDGRANEDALLIVMNTIWLREHNRLARQLEHLNPGWTDENIFQSARSIVIAQIQHITFNEYLPLILGKKFTSDYGLGDSGYNASVDVSILNEFATAAFQFYHSMAQGSVEWRDSLGNVEVFQLRKLAYHPSLILSKKDSIASFIRGALRQNAHRVDRFFTKQLTNHWFQTPNSKYGLDLVAYIIQRGRDHGIPNYNSVRRGCNLEAFSSFDSLEMTSNCVHILRQLYTNVEDIDLYAGGMCEKTSAGMQLGQTFSHIIAEQFSRIRQGDRFWYERRDQFNEDRLSEIRKISLARVICDNVRTIKRIQKRALEADVSLLVSCENLPELDLLPWEDLTSGSLNY